MLNTQELKIIITYILFIFSLSSFSQEEKKTDTIFIKEVTVIKKNPELLKYRVKGPSVNMGTGEIFSGFVSRFEKIPEGKLSTLKLQFNKPMLNIVKRQTKTKYKSVEFKLVLMSVAEDGSIGQSILSAPIIIKVNADHRGKIILDLESLEIETQNEMYIGIESLDKLERGSFTVSMVSDKKAKTYGKSTTDEKWYPFPDYQIKVEVQIRK